MKNITKFLFGLMISIVVVTHFGVTSFGATKVYYKFEVRYLNDEGEELVPSFVYPRVAEGSPYGAVPRIIKGWQCDQPQEATTGNMTSDLTITYTYHRKSYNLTINYVSDDGTELPIANPTVTDTLLYEDMYRVESPVIDGYLPTSSVVSGIADTDEDIEVTVTYVNVAGYTITNLQESTLTHTHTDECYEADALICSSDLSVDVRMALLRKQTYSCIAEQKVRFFTDCNTEVIASYDYFYVNEDGTEGAKVPSEYIQGDMLDYRQMLLDGNIMSNRNNCHIDCKVTITDKKGNGKIEELFCVIYYCLDETDIDSYASDEEFFKTVRKSMLVPNYELDVVDELTWKLAGSSWYYSEVPAKLVIKSAGYYKYMRIFVPSKSTITLEYDGIKEDFQFTGGECVANLTTHSLNTKHNFTIINTRMKPKTSGINAGIWKNFADTDKIEWYIEFSNDKENWIRY